MFSPLHAYLHDYDVMYSSVHFLHPLPPSCCQELKYVKETANKELADLEAVAHAHASRAQRLADEMAYLRAQYLEVKRQLDSSKQLQERDHELGETLRELKSDLAFVSLDYVRVSVVYERDTSCAYQQVLSVVTRVNSWRT